MAQVGVPLKVNKNQVFLNMQRDAIAKIKVTVLENIRRDTHEIKNAFT